VPSATNTILAIGWSGSSRICLAGDEKARSQEWLRYGRRVPPA